MSELVPKKATVHASIDSSIDMTQLKPDHQNRPLWISEKGFMPPIILRFYISRKLFSNS